MKDFKAIKDLVGLPVTLNSKKVRPGYVFVASKGVTPNSKDGHEFISEAIARGCVAVVAGELKDRHCEPSEAIQYVSDPRSAAAYLAECYYQNPSSQLKLCGVTGTNGKSTTAYLLAQIAEQASQTSTVIGSLGAGRVREEKPFGLTTPEAEDLSRMLRDFLDSGTQIIALEVSSIALATKRVEALSFYAAAFTNLSQDHLDFHKNLEDYFAQKERLFSELLAPGSTAIIPVCHPIKIKAGVKILTWGYSEQADISASNIRNSIHGLEFTLRIKDQKINTSSSLIGDFNLDNILCAAGLAEACGFSLKQIAEGIKCAKAPKGRLDRVNLPHIKTPAVFVDFAHTPDALENVIKTLKKLTLGRLIVVFGCGGDRDRSKRPLMAKAARDHADMVIVTQDNSRTEDPNQIIQDMKLINETVILDRKQAIGQAIDSADLEDVILIAGKGHETAQIIGNKQEYFDDSKVAYEHLFNRYKNN